ncbi:MAG: LysE family transporter [Oscillospiraceae bacterium]|nr:LysE family transporter [Oscillospiraceae bacterium]
MDIPAMLLYMAVTGVTPGPSNLMSLYLSAQYGFRGARKFMVGSSLGFFIKMLLCGALNVALAAIVPALVPYLKWLGAAYMLYLAFTMLRSGFAPAGEEKEKTGEWTYLSGLALQVVNIKSWVACLSVFSVYVTPHTTALPAILAVSVVNTCGMILWTVLWGSFGSAIRRVYAAHRKLFGIALAASLVLCAVSAL